VNGLRTEVIILYSLLCSCVKLLKLRSQTVNGRCLDDITSRVTKSSQCEKNCVFVYESLSFRLIFSFFDSGRRIMYNNNDDTYEYNNNNNMISAAWPGRYATQYDFCQTVSVIVILTSSPFPA